jgi:hypothetical protein
MSLCSSGLEITVHGYAVSVCLCVYVAAYFMSRTSEWFLVNFDTGILC